MPDWVLLVVAGVSALGTAVLVLYSMGERRRERRALNEVVGGWWRVGGGPPDP